MADFESDLQIDGKSIYSLRVIDLKQELKKRDIPFKTNATKAQLQTLLIEHLSQSIDTIEEDKLSEDNSHTTEQSDDTNETIKSNSEANNVNIVEDNKPIAEQTEATDLSQDSGITSSVSFGDKQSIKLTIKLQPNDSPTKQMSPKKSPTKEMRSPVLIEEVRKDIEEKQIIATDSQVVEQTLISSEDKTKDLDQREVNSLESKAKEETVVKISEEISTEKDIKSIDSEPKEEKEKQIEPELIEKNKSIDTEVKEEEVSQKEEKPIEKEKSIELEAKDQSLNPIEEKPIENENKSIDLKVKETTVEQIDDKPIEKDNKSIESELKSDEKISEKVEKTIENEKTMESQPKEETTDPTIKSTEKENKLIESKAKEEKVKPPRRRRWGSSVTTTDSQNARKGISSDQLKELLPDLNSTDNSSSALKVSKSDSIVVTSSLSRTQTTEENNEIPTKRDIRVVRKSVSVPEEEQTISEETISQPIVEQKTKIVVEIEAESKGEEELKREVSPPRSAESNILFIHNLVRPFTLLQLKELLRKTGKLNVDRFWIDNIKSKCYATYETTEEAVATRTALHGTRWPSSNPKLLSVDFATAEDLDSYLNPELNKELNNRKSDNDLNQKYDIVVRTEEQRSVLREKDNKNESRPIREWDREKLVNKEDDRKGRRRPNSPTNRSKSREQETKRRRTGEERVRPADSTSEEAPPTAEAVKRTESPAKLLDDLFRKTSATPSIYWLPLTEEQAVARLAIREEEEKKRTEERNAREEQFRKRQEERRPFDGPSPPFRNERNQWRNDGPSNRGGFGGRRGSPFRRSPFGRRSPPRRRSPVNRFSKSRSRSPFPRRKR